MFLSPHPDDAVLSCGGTLAGLHRLAQRTVILTVMAGDPPVPPPNSPLVRELHARWDAGVNPMATRRAEDAKAAAALHARVVHAPLLDCIYRAAERAAADAGGVALYPTGEAIFGSIHPQDEAPALLKGLRLDTLPGLETVAEVTHIYAPLAVGNHVDHQLVRDWAQHDVARRYPTAELRFYEDYPYAEDAEAVVGARAGIAGELHPVELVMREDDVSIKLSALRAYHSQISSFWHDPDDMDTRIRTFMTRTGGGIMAERCWRVSVPG